MVYRNSCTLLTLLCLSAASGCATLRSGMGSEIALDPGAEKIRLFMSEQRDCKFISEVRGDYVAKEPYEETDEKARIRLKNAALAAKANAVVIVSMDRQKTVNDQENPVAAYTKILGTAYNCRNLGNR